MKKAIRPAILKWRQTEPELILCGVRWYLRYSLSYRDVEELLSERGLEADHTTSWRWVQHYGPELEERLRRHLKPTYKSWRVDETCVRVNGRWGYLGLPHETEKSYAKRHPKGRWWITIALSPRIILHCPVEAYPSLTSGTVRWGVRIGL